MPILAPFLVGVALGLIPTACFAIGAIWAFSNRRQIEDRIEHIEENPLRLFRRDSVEIFDPPAVEDLAAQEVISENELRGRDTKTTDLN